MGTKGIVSRKLTPTLPGSFNKTVCAPVGSIEHLDSISLDRAQENRMPSASAPKTSSLLVDSGKIHALPRATILKLKSISKKTRTFPAFHFIKMDIASSIDEGMFLLLVEDYGFDYAIDACRRFNLDCARIISIVKQVFGRALYRFVPLRESQTYAASKSSPRSQT